MPPLLRPGTALRAARQVQSLRATPTTTSTTTPATTRLLSGSSPRRGAHGEGSRYDEPTGWLWGVRPGEKYQNEGWERPFFWGYCGSLVVFAIVYQFKPDTSIETWALEEARRRLEAEGILEDPYPNGVPKK